MEDLGRLSIYAQKALSAVERHAFELNAMACSSSIEARLFAGSGDLYLASRPKGLYSSKKDNGSALIIGGSESFHGAPAMASNAAYSTLASLRVGAGYAVTYVPRPIVQPVRSLSPNLIVRQLSGSRLAHADLDTLFRAADRADSIAIGPGMGRDEESLKTAAEFISGLVRSGKRIVVDADAIYAIGLIRRRLSRNVIITPHDKEFFGLSETRLSKRDLVQRALAAVKTARRLNAVILLKGHDTVVTDGLHMKIIRSRTAALATMGTGDVLSGIICGFAARNTDAFVSAVAGAYLHSRIGDALFMEKGYHIIANDVVERIPAMLMEFDKTRK